MIMKAEDAGRDKMTRRTAVDGHVHIHPHADLAALLEAAVGNLSRLAGEGAGPCLLLTETARADVFAEMRAGRRVPPGWTIETPAADPAAIVACRGSHRLLLVAGRQIVTSEKLEVLALATCDRFADGASLDETLEALHAAGIPAVLPWGLGKWIGKRGGIVADRIARAKPGVILGDNKGRPIGWPAPRIFNADRGGIVLPGSDPLPIPGSETVVGSYGFLLEGGLDGDRPAADLSARLHGLTAQPPVFGTRLGPVAALRAQLALRRAKRAGVVA
tara:strand:- start:1824 stop:2648 length:825 start_codon:yes stop_codon:yes gene_type:complete